MPDVYISRAGMEHKELEQRFSESQIGELNQKLTKVELDANMKDERLRACFKNGFTQLLPAAGA
jgi:hypothetical protein